MSVSKYPLPILLSVPHSGREVPPELKSRCRLTPAEIEADGDVGSAQIYHPLADAVVGLVSASIARAFVDLNRAATDIRRDGVVKTHTCWQIPIYKTPLDTVLIRTLLQKYHQPYHQKLDRLAASQSSTGSCTAPITSVCLGVDCHTMAAAAPPIAKHPGARRPHVCLSNRHGKTCPDTWLEILATALAEKLPGPITRNAPFVGGYITHRRPGNLPWLQLELSRAPFASLAEKSAAVRHALTALCRKIGWIPRQPRK
jgi:N-formylglutamate amidohydrolase